MTESRWETRGTDKLGARLIEVAEDHLPRNIGRRRTMTMGKWREICLLWLLLRSSYWGTIAQGYIYVTGNTHYSLHISYTPMNYMSLVQVPLRQKYYAPKLPPDWGSNS